MGELGEALMRLEAAVTALETVLIAALEGDEAIAEAQEPPDVTSRLAEENAELRAAAARDAELRVEAAAAVKAALEDLRALMPEVKGHG